MQESAMSYKNQFEFLIRQGALWKLYFESVSEYKHFKGGIVGAAG